MHLGHYSPDTDHKSVAYSKQKSVRLQTPESAQRELQSQTIAAKAPSQADRGLVTPPRNQQRRLIRPQSALKERSVPFERRDSRATTTLRPQSALKEYPKVRYEHHLNAASEVDGKDADADARTEVSSISRRKGSDAQLLADRSLADIRRPTLTDYGEDEDSLHFDPVDRMELYELYTKHLLCRY